MTPKKRNKILPSIILVAGTKAQADSWIMNYSLDPCEVIVASSAERLHGLHDMPVVYYGTYQQRPDYAELKRTLDAIRNKRKT